MTEIVLSAGERAGTAHKELFRYSDHVYVTVRGDMLAAIEGLSDDLSRIHIVGAWADILSIAVWKVEPTMGDLFVLLKKIGMKTEELLPFRSSATWDLFPWLYYGKRFHELRRICRAAKAEAERHLRNRQAQVYCHLLSEDDHRIVASSL